MILAIDMGNTNIKIGVVASEDDITEERVTTDYDKSSLEYAEDILSVLNFHNIPKEQIEGAIISSVVPPLTGIVATAVRKSLAIEPLITTSSMKMDIGLHSFKYPKGVGADLVVGAEAAYHNYKAPCIIVNMGTATTITLVDDNAEFLGGVILPGMRISLNALSEKTAILPEISLEKPGRVISRDTVQCIRSGVVYSQASGIDGIIDRMEAELGKPCTHLATGGMARFVVDYCSHDIKLDDGLIMKGLYRLYELNKTKVKCRRKKSAAAASKE